ncbi:TetR/AcrR family transcriptional regulator C-terminal domain-containing protein [Actinomadura rupiterrae]|uniref:TetR/AcrR family transcriptional regulator C-terminal domain-containing protein n=1 Tax=Actinomadura rupiterrae TaxID=559627 RepID=UPI0020A4313E|nr:TetR/AcrR family transcriptional regulator C-terminal domain-containing protein [Actinomadura rupiterrae]MCP2337672.1 AcrR family transcriptional regulator [Actinomadura rupiterrae]
MGKPVGLTRERVLDAALALVDRDGLAKLSMRRLGAELGVEAMTLYHYVPNKDALLDGVIEQVIAGAEPQPAPGLDWIAEFARSLRRELLAHPRVVPLLASRPISTPGGLDMLERALEALAGVGLSPLEAACLLNAVATFTVGHVLAEIPDEDAAELPDLARYPHVARAVADGLGTPSDHRARFDRALQALVAGLSPGR